MNNQYLANLPTDVQREAIDVATDHIQSNSLTVLITLSIVGLGVYWTGRKLSNFLVQSVWPDVQKYLTTQNDAVGSLLIKSDATIKTTEQLLEKLDEIELDIKEIKIIVQKQ